MHCYNARHRPSQPLHNTHQHALYILACRQMWISPNHFLVSILAHTFFSLYINSVYSNILQSVCEAFCKLWAAFLTPLGLTLAASYGWQKIIFRGRAAACTYTNGWPALPLFTCNCSYEQLHTDRASEQPWTHMAILSTANRPVCMWP